jgi:hypothetical protein
MIELAPYPYRRYLTQQYGARMTRHNPVLANEDYRSVRADNSIRRRRGTPNQFGRTILYHPADALNES